MPAASVGRKKVDRRVTSMETQRHNVTVEWAIWNVYTQTTIPALQHLEKWILQVWWAMEYIILRAS